MANHGIHATYQPLNLRNALLAAPPALALEALRTLAARPGAQLSPDLLASLRARVGRYNGDVAAREIEILFDLGTGRSRAAPTESTEILQWPRGS